MEEAELKRLATHRVDTRSRCGSDTSLAARIALTKIPEGSVLEVIASEEGTKADVRQWADHSRQDFLGVIPERGFERIFVRRRQ